MLGDLSCLLQSIVDALNGIFSHSQEEAGAHLGLWSARVEKCRGRMGEPLLTHQVVSLKSRFQIVEMDANGSSHEHVLGAFDDFSIYFEQVCALERRF